MSMLFCKGNALSMIAVRTTYAGMMMLSLVHMAGNQPIKARSATAQNLNSRMVCTLPVLIRFVLIHCLIECSGAHALNDP
jgi:hypothetical protein